jgi:small subunit ribosomal protein S17
MALKEFTGVVVSNKMSKTRIVSVNERVYHKVYKKVITKTKRYAARDVEFNAAIGDIVKIQQTRPISKTVSWVVTNILEKSST